MLITTRFFPTRPLGRSRAHKVLERDILVYRRNWTIIVSGFFEPIFYLLGIGFGLGTLVGDVGDIPYAAFVAPGLMATAAMNGALFESTFILSSSSSTPRPSTLSCRRRWVPPTSPSARSAGRSPAGCSMPPPSSW